MNLTSLFSSLSLLSPEQVHLLPVLLIHFKLGLEHYPVYKMMTVQILFITEPQSIFLFFLFSLQWILSCFVLLFIWIVFYFSNLKHPAKCPRVIEMNSDLADIQSVLSYQKISGCFSPAPVLTLTSICWAPSHRFLALSLSWNLPLPLFAIFWSPDSWIPITDITLSKLFLISHFDWGSQSLLSLWIYLCLHLCMKV